MVELDDNAVKKIVNETLDERRKRNTPKFFHNPQKAEGLAYILGILFVGAVAVAVVGNSIPANPLSNIESGGDNVKAMEKMILADSSCQELHQLLHDSNQKTDVMFKYFAEDLKSEIISRC
jgi:hypothetical protein